VVHGDEAQVRVACDGRVVVDAEGHERIVLGVNEQRRDLDVLEELIGGLRSEVIGRRSKAEERGGVVVVEIDDGVDFGQVVQRVDFGGLKMFAADASFEAVDETVLVEPVLAKFEGFGARGEFDGRGDGDDSGKKIASLRSQFTGEFESNIASERVACQEERRWAEALALANYGQQVGGLARVVAGDGEILRTAAAAHVETVGGVTALERREGHALHVAGRAGALEAVDQNDFALGHGVWTLGVDQDLDFGLSAIEHGVDGPALVDLGAGPEVSGERRQVGVAEERMEGAQIKIVRCRGVESRLLGFFSQPLPVGSLAPDFSLPDQDGKLVSLSGLRGRNVVLVFYPADDTSVCTQQLCEFRDRWTLVEQKNVVVLGMNPAKGSSHSKFRERYQLPLPILVDRGQKVGAAYRARGLVVPRRTVYLIGPDGVIRYARRGKPEPEEVLAAAILSHS
jgi:peroxiredoxin Q/BCP